MTAKGSVFTVLCLLGLGTGAPAGDAVPVTEHDVLPILLRRCSNCHGAAYQEGELDLRGRISYGWPAAWLLFR